MTFHRTRPNTPGSKAALALALAIAAVASSGCKKNVECTAEVTAGDGSFKSTTKGEETDKPILRREAVRAALGRADIRG